MRAFPRDYSHSVRCEAHLGWNEISAINGLALACYELRLQPLVHFLGPLQCLLHVVADVFWADYFREFPLVDQLCGLLAGAAEDKRPFASVQLLGDFFQGEEAGSVESCHVAKAQDDD